MKDNKISVDLIEEKMDELGKPGENSNDFGVRRKNYAELLLWPIF